MAETYDEIVRKWYVRLRGNFTDMLMSRYSGTDMRLADAENIYQDIFLAIHRNIQEGRIGPNCDWKNYIIRVGLNMASKKYRDSGKCFSIDERNPEDEDLPSARVQKITELLQSMPAGEGESFYSDPQAQNLLGDELTHTPEPCASIIHHTYFGDMSDREIAETISPYRDNGKSVETNAKAVRARRWLCMRDLIYRVKMSLYNAGIISEKPEKKRRNG